MNNQQQNNIGMAIAEILTIDNPTENLLILGHKLAFTNDMPITASIFEEKLEDMSRIDMDTKRNDEQPRPKHNDPEDYGLTTPEAAKMKLRYLRQELEKMEVQESHYVYISLTAREDVWLIQDKWNHLIDKINSTKVSIAYWQQVASGKEVNKKYYDKEQLKEVRIDQFVTNQNNKKQTMAGTIYCCEFHNDSNPSMYVYKDNHYYCYTCQAGGDVFNFIMKKEKLDFPKACAYLAQYL